MFSPLPAVLCKGRHLEGWRCQDADEDGGAGQTDFSAALSRARVGNLPLILSALAFVSASLSSPSCIQLPPWYRQSCTSFISLSSYLLIHSINMFIEHLPYILGQGL